MTDKLKIDDMERYLTIMENSAVLSSDMKESAKYASELLRSLQIVLDLDWRTTNASDLFGIVVNLGRYLEQQKNKPAL